MELILIYDIATPDRQGERRLRRVAKACEGFGIRVQRSVFECRITEASYEQFIHTIRQIIDHRIDRVTIYIVPGGIPASRTDLGAQAPFTIDSPWIL